MTWLSGKKTIIGVVAGAVLGVLTALGVVSAETQWVQVLAALIVAWTGISVRLAIEKSGNGK